jgi:two-component system chemotaxis sensor kinase CheA
VDIYNLIETLHPDWFETAEVTQKTVTRGEATVLYAEDSNFFRNQVKGYLEDDGYKVLEAEDGVIAWEMMQKHYDEISLVITDIEMPNLDGFGFVKKLRADKRFLKLPVIALTTMASDEDIARGATVGINDYQVKLDKDKLMESVRSYLRGM